MLSKSRLIAGLYIACTLFCFPLAEGVCMEDDLSLDMELDLDDEAEESKTEPLTTTKELAARASKAVSAAVKKAPETINDLIPVNMKRTGSQSTAPTSPKVDLLTRIKNKMSFTTSEIENWVLSQEDVNVCMENGKTMLIYLISGYDNVEAVRFLLDNGADLHTHCTPQYEALFVALKENASLPMLETLINGGANIVATDEDGNTPLIIAAAYHTNPDVITSLFEFGLKSDTKNKFGYDALTMAAYHNNLPIVRTIADNLINLNARDAEGRTPLMAAAIRGNDMIMQYLIRQGADFNAADNNGITVLDYYNKRGYLQTLSFKPMPFSTLAEQLNQEYNFIAENHLKYNTMLQQGIYQQNADELVAEAIANNADIDKPNTNGCTTFLNAVHANAPLSVLDKLLNAKADINATCQNGKNALMDTLAMPETTLPALQKTEKARFLINRGININAQDDNGDTPLIYAAQYNAPSGLLKALLNADARINTANKTGETALLTAVKQRIPAANLDILLSQGADVNKADNSGESPLRYAVKNNSTPDIIQTLLEHGADTETPDVKGETPLWYALNHNLPVATTALLAAFDTNINNLNPAGDTPLLFAIKNDLAAPIVKNMLNNGADPQIRGRDGKNAYDILKNKQFFNEAMKKQTRERVLGEWN